MTISPTARIAIVVVAYNTRDLLRQCLQSIDAAELPARVVVVDNVSHDGSPDLIRSSFPQVTLIANAENRGFAAGTNQGIAWVMGDRGWALGNLSSDPPPDPQPPTPDYVLLLNPDAQLRPGALQAMTEFMDRHPRVGAVGARLLYPDGSPQESAWHFPTLWMTFFDLFPPRGPLLGRLYASPLNGRYREERSDQPFPIDHPLGAALMMRRATIAEVGLLDEAYWTYVEEVDWCYRCRQAGWAIWQVPQAKVIHVAGASSRQIRSRSFIALHRSRLRFYSKHYGPRRQGWNRRIVRLGMLWATLQAWRAWQRDLIDQDELRRRLFAYGRVIQLTFE